MGKKDTWKEYMIAIYFSILWTFIIAVLFACGDVHSMNTVSAHFITSQFAMLAMHCAIPAKHWAPNKHVCWFLLGCLLLNLLFATVASQVIEYAEGSWVPFAICGGVFLYNCFQFGVIAMTSAGNKDGDTLAHDEVFNYVNTHHFMSVIGPAYCVGACAGNS